MAKDKKEKKKTKRPTAEKRMIQSKKKRLLNRAQKSELRTAIRNLDKAIAGKDQAQSQKELNTVYSLVDKAVKTGVLKKNQAARTKSRLTAKAARN